MEKWLWLQTCLIKPNYYPYHVASADVNAQRFCFLGCDVEPVILRVLQSLPVKCWCPLWEMPADVLLNKCCLSRVELLRQYHLQAILFLPGDEYNFCFPELNPLLKKKKKKKTHETGGLLCSLYWVNEELFPLVGLEFGLIWCAGWWRA